MAEIGGTQFIGISAGVPIPENKSAQNNSFQEVYTIDDISSYVLPVPVMGVLIQDFFVFASESNIVPFPSIIFKVDENKVNGFLAWTSEYDGIKYKISVNSGQVAWELYGDNAYIAEIEDVQGQVPPSGDWDFDGDLVAVNILYVSGSIQEVIEQLAIGITG